jgi:hypothetical protein
MKAHYLGWFLVVGSAVAVLGRQVDVVVGLERAEEPGGPWVAVGPRGLATASKKAR